MTVNQEMIRAAIKLARQDPALDTALHDWWRLQGTLPTALRGKPFGVWLIDLLNELSTTIDGVFHGEQTAENIVDVLRIHAIGDPLARQLADEAERDGFGTDTNCYVEDGYVNANVYLHSADHEKVMVRAKKVMNAFTASGYSADIWVDEDDARDVTINAKLDFKLFREKAKICYNKESNERK